MIKSGHRGIVLENKITWSNKDFVSKVLSDTFAEKSFSVYGIDLPPIAERVEKEEQRVFVLAAIAVANNKFITQEQLNRIEEVLRMTRLSQQIFDKWKADTLSYGDGCV